MKVAKPKALVPSWYEMEVEDNKVDNPSFLLKPLSKFEMAQVGDHIKTDPKTGFVTIEADGQYLAVRLGAKDVKNMYYEDGSLCDFSEWRDWLSPILVKLLAYEIVARSTMTEDDIKKSLQQSRSISQETNSTVEAASGEDTATSPTPSPGP